MPRTASQQRLVDSKIDEVLARASLPVDSPLRGLFDRDAEIFDAGREFAVHVPRPGRDISLRERLEEIRYDPMFSDNFPSAPPKIGRKDGKQAAGAFDEVASGKVKVE